MLGTMATPEFLADLPRERLIAALDEKGGEVVVEGWTKGTGRKIEERMAALAPYVSGFLVTFVDEEGSLGGIGIGRAKSLIASAKVASGARRSADHFCRRRRRSGRNRPARSPRFRRPGGHRDRPRQAHPRRGLCRDPLLRQAGRPLAHRRLRRRRQGPRPRLVEPGKPDGRDRERPRRLPLPQPRALAQGRELGRRAGAHPRRGRLRPRRHPLHRAPEGPRLLPPGPAQLLGRRLGDRASRADALVAQVRRARPAPTLASSSTIRASSPPSSARRPTSSTRPRASTKPPRKRRTSSTSRSRRRSPRARAWPPSRRSWTAGPCA